MARTRKGLPPTTWEAWFASAIDELQAILEHFEVIHPVPYASEDSPGLYHLLVNDRVRSYLQLIMRQADELEAHFDRTSRRGRGTAAAPEANRPQWDPLLALRPLNSRKQQLDIEQRVSLPAGGHLADGQAAEGNGTEGRVAGGHEAGACNWSNGANWWWAKTFEAFDAAVPGVGEAHEATRAYAERPRGWLAICGGCGAGKTHLAAAIANRRREEGSSVIYASAPDLFQQLYRLPDGSNAEKVDALLTQLREVDLLVLDDLTVLHVNQGIGKLLLSLVNHRAAHSLSTVLTLQEDPRVAVDSKICADSPERVSERLRALLRDPSLTRCIRLAAMDHRSRSVLRGGEGHVASAPTNV